MKHKLQKKPNSSSKKRELPRFYIAIIGVFVIFVLGAILIYFIPPSSYLKSEIPQIFKKGEQLLPGPSNGAVGEFKSSYVVTEVVPWAVQFMLQLAAALAVVFMILGGWFYVTSMGDEAMTAKGRTVIMWAIFGLVFSILSYAIVDIINSIKW